MFIFVGKAFFVLGLIKELLILLRLNTLEMI